MRPGREERHGFMLLHQTATRARFVGEVPRTASAKALTKVETLKISKELFMKIIRENPDAAVELIRILAARLASTTSQLTRTRSGGR